MAEHHQAQEALLLEQHFQKWAYNQGWLSFKFEERDMVLINPHDYFYPFPDVEVAVQLLSTVQTYAHLLNLPYKYWVLERWISKKPQQARGKAQEWH